MLFYVSLRDKLGIYTYKYMYMYPLVYPLLLVCPLLIPTGTAAFTSYLSSKCSMNAIVSLLVCRWYTNIKCRWWVVRGAGGRGGYT